MSTAFNLFIFHLFSVVAMAVGNNMSSLTFVGMVGILDPPRPGIRDAVEALIGSGVTLKMVTGDSQETAIAIGTMKTEDFNISFTLARLMTRTKS